jgi:uncharacterized protein YraI
MTRLILSVLAVLFLLSTLLVGQANSVTAEALGQANLRAAADVNSVQLGQITNGTRYPVIGRSQFYPWLLLGDPNTLRPIGWVFAELVQVYGDINDVPFTEVGLVTTSQPSSPTAPQQLTTTTPAPSITSLTTPTVLPTSGVVGTVKGEINIRYGPGVDYPRIGVARAGETYEITAYHTQFPWIQVRYPAAPNGYGWVANDLMDIQGNIYTLTAINQTIFDLPTLTATPPAVQTSIPVSGTHVPISASFQALGDTLWNMTLAAGFDPQTSRLASMFLINLQTGEALSFGSQIAFSGMSLTKIAILTDLYNQLQTPPSLDTAVHVANMMVCSENSASNALLRTLGDGDPYAGAQSVTKFLRELGLQNTYMVAPYAVPDATPAPVTAPTTTADQVRAQPDYSNQMTVEDMGWLLAGIYQCAYSDSGLLMNRLPGAFDQRECRQMLDVMSSNNLTEPLLMSAGVPAGTRVAHKHGWIADTHGNAGIVFTPGGDYVFVVALHSPVWLDFSESFPLISEMSRTIYNYFNPTVPLDTPRTPNIVEVNQCQVAGTPIIDELTSYSFGD